MARFNVYDALPTQESYEEEKAEREAEGQREIPPISREGIENLTYKRGVQLLRDMEVRTDQMKTLEDIKCFLRLRYFSNNEDNTSFIADIERQIQLARQRQKILLEAAEIMERQLVRPEDPAVAEIISELEVGVFEGWVANLAALKQKLEVRDTAILITGETGAGKSSLINLLIGQQLLPSAEHPCTAAICTIRNSERSLVRLHNTVDLEASQDGSGMVEFELDAKEQWMESVSNRTSVDSSRRVEFYCPIPLLKENAYFVDSPGFREGPTLTNVLTEFLPEASAFIIVLMTDNCTGFNTSVESFIGDICKTIQRRTFFSKGSSCVKMAGGMSVDNVIFVFNRWDKVVDDMSPEDADKLRNTCLERLRKLWPVVVEDHNVFFMSVSKIDSMMSQKACGPPVFVKFQKALFGMIPRAIDSLVKTAFEWMLTVSHCFIDSTRLRLNNARKSKEKRDEETDKLKNLMKSLRESFDLRSRSLRADIADRVRRLKRELLEHLKSPAARSRMSNVNGDAENYGAEVSDIEAIPKANNPKEIRMQLNLFTQKRIHQEILWWNQKDAVIENKETKSLELHPELTRFSKFMKSIQDVCYETFSVFEKHARVMHNIVAIESLLGGSQAESEDSKLGFLSNLEKVFFGVTAIIWIPLLVVSGTITLPFAAGIFVNKQWNSGKKLEHFNKRRYEVCQAYLQVFLDKELKEQVLDIFLYEVLSYSEAIQQRIDNYMDLYSQSIMAKVNLLSNEWRTFEEIQKLFNPVLNDVKIVLNHLYHFHGLELKVYEYHKEKFSDFERGCADKVSEGSFSVIYKAFCESRREVLAIKLMREAFSDNNALEIFTEEKAWRKLCRSHHKNFVYLFGMFFDERTYQIGFVMEKCDMTLSQFLQKSPNFVPFKQKSTDAMAAAFHKMLSLAKQVTKALYFVHANNYVHRDLRLENVLVMLCEDEVVIKLCDFGWSKSQNDITHSIRNDGIFDIYSSPEIWETEGTTAATDIYSLGILLWEMFHAERITVHVEVSDLESLFVGGQASLIPIKKKMGSQMPAHYMELLRKCTSFKTLSRPSIDEVHERVDLM